MGIYHFNCLLINQILGFLIEFLIKPCIRFGGVCVCVCVFVLFCFVFFVFVFVLFCFVLFFFFFSFLNLLWAIAPAMHCKLFDILTSTYGPGPAGSGPCGPGTYCPEPLMTLKNIVSKIFSLSVI